MDRAEPSVFRLQSKDFFASRVLCPNHKIPTTRQRLRPHSEVSGLAKLLPNANAGSALGEQQVRIIDYPHRDAVNVTFGETRPSRGNKSVTCPRPICIFSGRSKFVAARQLVQSCPVCEKRTAYLLSAPCHAPAEGHHVRRGGWHAHGRYHGVVSFVLILEHSVRCGLAGRRSCGASPACIRATPSHVVYDLDRGECCSAPRRAWGCSLER
ncbi:hypothetical protein C8Q79DRAFT_537841 [Trametes meyenii]|nr:hypothetical protein C8Q79DRAFT_537841 [Trametes meyenii]